MSRRARRSQSFSVFARVIHLPVASAREPGLPIRNLLEYQWDAGDLLISEGSSRENKKKDGFFVKNA
jgi:hypothetical protein